jgi:hypothetical protein
MGKIKLSFFDKIFKGNKCNDILKVFYLREQCEFMNSTWKSIDIFIQLSKYRQINYDMHQFDIFILDEEKMMNDLGISSVIERLEQDRSKMISLLKDVKEIDLSEINRKIREEKLNYILQ